MKINRVAEFFYFTENNYRTDRQTISFYELNRDGSITSTDFLKPILTTDLTAKPEEITLNLKKSDELAQQLDVSVRPENTTDEIAYAVSDPKIVEINDSGLITAKEVGEAIVTVAAGSIQKEVKVNVISYIPPTSLNVSPSDVTFYLGTDQTTKQLDVTVEPSDCTEEVTYESKDSNVATVSDKGLVTARNDGETTVTVKVDDLEKDVVVKVINKLEIYRLYNNHSGEHLYTPAVEEVRALENCEWTNEGLGWNAPRIGTPIYRLYNPALADHLYTSDENEVNVLTSSRGWVADFNRQPIFYSSSSGTQIYRLYNEESKRHLFTKDANEYGQLPGYGWKQEGVSLFGID